jgi:phosphopentomutase
MRFITIVLDSVGVGEMEDSWKYGDEGSNTLGNLSKAVSGISLPNMEKLGLGNLTQINGVAPVEYSLGAYGKMKEKSDGKDSTTGHWEFMGIILKKPFDFFPNGFPREIIAEFESLTGRKVIGNVPASGTEIIKEFGKRQHKTGELIVYTSADSVFQIAAPEEIISVDELYKCCEIARELLDKSGYKVARVIARPYVGEYPNYTRTSNRHDYSLPPDEKTDMEFLVEAGINVYAVGKINDLYDGHGVSEYQKTKDNMDGVDKTIDYIKKKENGFIFTNLVDYDAKYGHRNDPVGYAKALEEFDERLPEIYNVMKNDDVLILTADHGCDPTTPSTDHSREMVPLLIYGNRVKEAVDLGIRESFSDLGKTVLDFFGVKGKQTGESFLKEIIKGS